MRQAAGGRAGMIVLGLTGSIAMGKSTAAAMLRRMRVPVHDSDQAVHRLIGPGGACVPAIREAFPQAVVDGRVDRPRLGAAVFDDPAGLARLEAILHPAVRRDAARFLAVAARRRARLAVLDVPLLLETGRERAVDRVVVVTAPAFVQRQRALARPGMTERRLDAILARQVPDARKRRLADFVVPTGLGRAATRHRLAAVLAAARPARRPAWPPFPPPERPHARNRARHRNHRPRPRA